jgi:hypothetical protein
MESNDVNTFIVRTNNMNRKHCIESGYNWLKGMGKTGFKGATSDKRYI